MHKNCKDLKEDLRIEVQTCISYEKYEYTSLLNNKFAKYPLELPKVHGLAQQFLKQTSDLLYSEQQISL